MFRGSVISIKALIFKVKIDIFFFQVVKTRQSLALSLIVRFQLSKTYTKSSRGHFNIKYQPHYIYSYRGTIGGFLCQPNDLKALFNCFSFNNQQVIIKTRTPKRE